VRIAFLTFAFQHPRMRGSARQYHLMRGLAPRHGITLLALSEVPVPADVREDVAAFAERVEIFETGAGRTAGRRERERAYRAGMARMREALVRLHAERPFDVAVLHGRSLLPVWAGIPDLPLVADICDADWMRIRKHASTAPLRRRPALLAYAAVVRRRERGLAGATPWVSFISARDRDAVVGPASRAVVIPNGVDLEFWRRRSAGPSGVPRLVFSGVMDYRPNEDAAIVLADRVLPLVRERVPEAEAVLVGRDPRRPLLERASRPGITVTGYVEDVRPYLEGASLFVAPMRFASGQQNKVLEAMAMEVAVVTTPVVAAGMEVGGNAAPLVVADGPDAIAGAVVRLLRDDEERRRLAAAGRRFVEQHAVWARSAEALEALCGAAAEERPAPAR
jgi:glycosyltransferase involved in cell wall biosynthesis